MGLARANGMPKFYPRGAERSVTGISAARNFALRHGMRKPRRNILRGIRFVLPDRLIDAAKGVHVVIKIPHAILAGMKALAVTAETNSARAGGLAVERHGNERASFRASSTAEISFHVFVHIVNADFARPTPKPIGALATLGNLAADCFEFPRVLVSGVTVLKTFAGYVLDSIKI